MKNSPALGIKRVVGHKFQALALYFAATPAIYTAHLEIEIDAHVPGFFVTYLPDRSEEMDKSCQITDPP